MADIIALDTQRSMLDFAGRYIRLGWYVLPLDPGTKKPLGRLVPRGFQDASNDLEVASKWWRTHPDAGIGIALRASGLVAVDIDPRNGGIDTMSQLEGAHGAIVSDVLAITGGGGEHRVFSADLVDGLPGTLGPGVDLKADGYIAVEPTIHPSGKRYGWELSSNPLDGVVPSTLPSWIRSLSRDRLALPAVSVPSAPLPASRMADLLSALEAIKQPDRDSWFRVGMAINNSMPNSDGFAMWDQWSQYNGSAYDPQDQFRVWKSFRPVGLAGVGLDSVFRMAIDAGWRSIRSKVPVPVVNSAAGTGETEHKTLRRLKRSTVDIAVLPPVEWVLDGFIASRQLVVFAGQPGVGKSTVFSAIALLVAGFGGAMGSDVKNGRPRRVAVVSEHSEQYGRLFYGYCKRFGLDVDAVKASVYMYDTARLTVTEIPGEVAAIIEDMPGDEPPFILLDTASAMFDVADENNNAEIAGMIDALKKPVSTTGAPIWVIAHAAKAMGREESDITPRGASAYAGDVHATGSVFRDKNIKGSTFIKSLKNRNEREFTEIEVKTEAAWHHVADEHGEIQRVGIRLGVPMMSGDEKRIMASERASEATREADQAKGMDVLRERISLALRAAIESGQLLSATDLAGNVSGKKSAILDCINTMVLQGDLVVTDWPKELRPRPQKQHFYRFPQTDVKTLLEAFSAQKSST